MSNIVTMTQTVNDLTNASTYRVRSKEAELLVAQSKATKSVVRGPASNVLPSKEGKRGL